MEQHVKRYIDTNVLNLASRVVRAAALVATWGCVIGVGWARTGWGEAEDGCAASSSQAEITACYGALLREAEAAMNREIVSIKALKPFLDSADLAERLDDSQLAFLAYRKQVCEGVFAFRGAGTAQYSEALACQLLLDRQRTAALENFYGGASRR